MKSKSQYVCQSCAGVVPKWQGQCPSCGSWNSLVEEIMPQISKSKSGLGGGRVAPEAMASYFSQDEAVSAQKQRLSTQIGELDRVLGGGIVPGAVMLIGGEPGIGKSTLLTQVVLSMIAASTAAQSNQSKLKASQQQKLQILYVCGEESQSQITLRINRMINNEQENNPALFGSNLVKKLANQLQFTASTDVDSVISLIHKHKPTLVIVDSIQAMTTQDLTGASGSVGQLREATDRLVSLAKTWHIPMFLVGHVTKEGAIAGPKVLEHIVDSVIELSGERTGRLRIVRALKNRFGATDEVGIFEVVDHGLSQVDNPSQLFLEHAGQGVIGSATVCVIEGTRPLLTEVQALVVKSQLAIPRRVGRGVQQARIQVLTAVLERYCKLPLGSYDIYLNAAGGFSVQEPAVDLGLAVAIASSLKNLALPAKSVFVGEVGLLGEIRAVAAQARREKESKRLGYSRFFSRESTSSVAQLLKELKIT